MHPNRLEAARRGKTTYKGEPCKHHPSALRYVAGGGCKACNTARAKQRYDANKRVLEKLRAEHVARGEGCQTTG